MRRTKQVAVKKYRSQMLVNRWLVEELERRVLLSTYTWVGASSGNWNVAANWSGNPGHTPGAGDTAIINTAAPLTVTVNDTESVRTLTIGGASGDTLQISGGSLTVGTGLTMTASDTLTVNGGALIANLVQVAGAAQLSSGALTINGSGTSQITGALTVTGGTLTATGTGTVLQTNGTGTISNATLDADSGGSIAIQQATGLTDVNLTADGGGQLLFPMATQYIGGATTTVQSSGPFSKIDLSHLTSFGSSNKHVTASNGGEVDLAGAMSGFSLTLSDATSKFDVSKVTSLNGSVTATGGTLAFSICTTLTDTNLTANGGALISFPLATQYIGGATTTVQSSGPSSKIDLSHLTNFGSSNKYVTASNGGEVDLAGAMSGFSLTLSDATSKFDVSKVTSLNGSVTATGGTLAFSICTTLTDTNLTANEGALIPFPLATQYIGGATTTVQSSGPSSRIDLSHLTSFGSSNKHVTASNGGEVDLAGAMSGFSLTLSDATSKFDVSKVTSLNGSVTATGGTLAFSICTTLTDTNLTANGGALISFPLATQYIGGATTTVQSSGPFSKIDLSHLTSFGSSNKHVTASNGGEVDLAGAMSGFSLTLSDATSKFDVSKVTSLNGSVTATGGTLAFSICTTLTDTNLTANGGALISFPLATQYIGGATTTVQSSGPSSKIDLSHLTNFGSSNKYVTASNGGEVDLSGDVTGSSLTLTGSASILGVLGITQFSNVTVTAAAGATMLFPAASHPTLASGVTLTATGGSHFIIQGAVTLSGAQLTINSDSLTSLTISAGGKLDLGGNSIVINYAPGADPITSIRGYIAAGYNSGGWNGTGSGTAGVITSTAAKNNVKHNTGVGYSDWADGSGVNQTPNSIELKYTLNGDANLDGKVTPNDFSLLAAHFNTPSGALWTQGDLNYDGKVTPNDFSILAANFNQVLPAGEPAVGQDVLLAIASTSNSTSPTANAASEQSDSSSASASAILASSNVSDQSANKHKVQGKKAKRP